MGASAQSTVDGSAELSKIGACMGIGQRIRQRQTKAAILHSFLQPGEPVEDVAVKLRHTRNKAGSRAEIAVQAF